MRETKYLLGLVTSLQQAELGRGVNLRKCVYRYIDLEGESYS